MTLADSDSLWISPSLINISETSKNGVAVSTRFTSVACMSSWITPSQRKSYRRRGRMHFH